MPTPIEKDTLLNLYRTMLTVRYFEENISQYFAQGAIPGFIHLCIGQEAVAAGVCSHLEQQDYILTTHRGHGHLIAKGADLKKMAAEIFGRSTGYCKGYGGSMHIMAADQGILGANGIVAGGLPIAVGAAFSAYYRGTDQVTVAFFGDGATATGAFHEALNLAAIWNLPILFVCENNGWAEFTPAQVHTKSGNIIQKALAYNIPAATVDGDDVIAVYQQAGETIERIRLGQGPFFLECRTHRWHGHYEGDPQKYRPAEEKTQLQQHDPIPRLKDLLLKQQNITPEEIEQCQKECQQQIQEAINFALQSPWPEPQAITA